MRTENQGKLKVINLCGGKRCCPKIEINKTKVKIGEKGNLCILKREEWEILKRKIKENQI